MRYVIIRGNRNGRDGEVYHALEAENNDEALAKSAEFLAGDGAPVAGDSDDVFELAQVISKPLDVKVSFVASTKPDHERARGALLKMLKRDS